MGCDNKITVRIVNFKGLNFCGLRKQDDVLGLHFHGILMMYIQFSNFTWINRPTKSTKF